MARTGGTKCAFRPILVEQAPMTFTDFDIFIVYFFRCPASNVFSQKEATLILMTKFSSAKRMLNFDVQYHKVSIKTILKPKN